MEKRLFNITKKDLFDLFGRLQAGYRIFVPYKKGENLYLDLFDSGKEDSIEIGGVRQSQPFKSFLTLSREKVSGALKGFQGPVIVVGVKNCDLESLRLQDHVFIDTDPQDPFYANNRKNTLIISADCASCKETCFCIAMKGRPYPEAGADMNLSQLEGNFLVEVMSEKAQMVVDNFRMFFREAVTSDARRRDARRKAVSEQIEAFIAARGTPDTDEIRGMVKKNYNNTNLWEEMTSTCVECGACNLTCPTCHCFLLFDTQGREKQERFKVWDSCLYNSFARVAGGANPRKHLWERMRNRIDKKFSFFPDTMDYFACTGCGRCIDACAGNIDIREILKGLTKGSWKKPPHE